MTSVHLSTNMEEARAAVNVNLAYSVAPLQITTQYLLATALTRPYETLQDALNSFICIDGNAYMGNAQGKVMNHDDMECDCIFDKNNPKLACGEGCINRMLNIECDDDLCPCGKYCQNQQFQKRKYAKIELFKTDKKGFGLRALQDLPVGSFIFEYVGEVLTSSAFRKRIKLYSENSLQHFYFMSLTSDEVGLIEKIQCLWLKFW